MGNAGFRDLPIRSIAGEGNEAMPRYSSMPDRDERGRFMSDDDRDDRRGGYRGRNGDENEGRGGRRSMSRSRYDDEERSSRDRGQGGWFGDSEGHSEAAERGWEGRTSSRGASSSRRSSRDDDDYDNRSSRSSGRNQGHGGWFGDSRGHAEAARRGWQDR